MLFRRTTKLVELDAANKALAKAKPKNQEQVLVFFLTIIYRTVGFSRFWVPPIKLDTLNDFGIPKVFWILR